MGPMFSLLLALTAAGHGGNRGFELTVDTFGVQYLFSSGAQKKRNSAKGIRKRQQYSHVWLADI